MGKKQHSKDRIYLTAKEYAEHWGGFKEKKSSGLKALPYYCCSLSMQPFTMPYVTRDGFVFEITEVLPWIKEHGVHPITGKKLTKKHLIKLKFHKNANGKFACPVVSTEFNQYTHIVAIATTGNVYSYKAIKELNYKHKNMRDLLEDEPFTKQDVIHIQDPENMEKRAISHFMNIKKGEALAAKPKFNRATATIVDAVRKKQESITESEFRLKKRKAETEDGPPKKKKYYSTVSTTNAVAASFTSTIAPSAVKQQMKELTDEEVRQIRWRQVKGSGKKAYVRFKTNYGTLNLQIHCDLVPQTAHSFLTHCESGYYNNTEFHRMITSFMIQGGDPKGTGFGGESAWGGKLKDEFKKNLRHDMRGILSMANSGPNTGGSQFFITFGPQPDLDDKHTVFGELVGGNETLNKVEMVAVDGKDRPLKAIRISKIMIWKNPFHDPLPQELTEIQKKQQEEEERAEADRGEWWSNPGTLEAAMMDNSVGKYLKKKTKRKKKRKKGLGLPKPRFVEKDPKAKKGITRFSDFKRFMKPKD